MKDNLVVETLNGIVHLLLAMCSQKTKGWNRWKLQNDESVFVFSFHDHYSGLYTLKPLGGTSFPARILQHHQTQAPKKPTTL